jgi:membrane-bound lytic murein transglycosylase MltF
MFNKHASEFGLKPIMLAAFAMQESTCNPATVGGGGEQGLMQLTEDKCGAAPGGDCRDPVRSNLLVRSCLMYLLTISIDLVFCAGL